LASKEELSHDFFSGNNTEMKHVVASTDITAEIKKILQNRGHCEFHFQSLKAQSQY